MSCVSENGRSVIRTYLVHSTYVFFVPEATKDGKIVNPAVLIPTSPVTSNSASGDSYGRPRDESGTGVSATVTAAVATVILLCPRSLTTHGEEG